MGKLLGSGLIEGWQRHLGPNYFQQFRSIIFLDHYWIIVPFGLARTMKISDFINVIALYDLKRYG